MEGCGGYRSLCGFPNYGGYFLLGLRERGMTVFGVYKRRASFLGIPQTLNPRPSQAGQIQTLSPPPQDLTPYMPKTPRPGAQILLTLAP